MPFDAHYSDRGGEIYARVLSEILAQIMTGKSFDFKNVRTRYSDLVYGVNKENTRLVQTSVTHVADNPDRTERIREFIRATEHEAKVFRQKSYALQLIIDTDIDGINVPYSRRLYAGFQDIPFDSGPSDVAFLTVSCTTKPTSLRNPDCYHFYHMFIPSSSASPRPE